MVNLLKIFFAIFFLFTASICHGDEFSNFGIISSINLSGTNVAHHIKCYGSGCYVGERSRWLYLVDIKDPYKPEVEKKEQIAGPTFDVDDNYIYIYRHADSLDPTLWELAIYTRFDWNLLNTSETFHASGDFSTIRVQSGLAFISYGSNFMVFDVNKTADIKKLDAITEVGFSYGFAIGNAYAYVATADGLTVIDIASPSSLNVVSKLPLSSSCRAIALSGSTAYLVSNAGDVFSVDISDPLNPQLESSLQLFGLLEDIAIYSDYAYVVGTSTNPIVIDISDPADLHIDYAMANDHNNGWGHAVELRSGYAFISGSTPDFFVMGELKEEDDDGGGDDGGGLCFIGTAKN